MIDLTTVGERRFEGVIQLKNAINSTAVVLEVVGVAASMNDTEENRQQYAAVKRALDTLLEIAETSGVKVRTINRVECVV